MHERSLRLILNDYESLFYMLSTLNEKIYQRCINVLLTEVHKYLSDFSLGLMNKIFYLRQNQCISRSLMSLPRIIHETNLCEILLFTEQTSYDKHYPPR